MDIRISKNRVKGFLKTDGRRTVNEAGEEIILVGVGLGNWLLQEGYMWKCGGQFFDRPHRIEATVRHLTGTAYSKKFWELFRDFYITRRDVELIAACGFNSIRIPFNHHILLADEPGIGFIESGFALIDRLLGWCEEFNLYAVLDLHGAPGGQTGSNIDDCFDDMPRLFIDPESRERTIALWCEIARRYAKRHIVAAYDLLNEPIRTDLAHVPNVEYLHPELIRFYDDCTAAIREIDTTHIIQYEGANWASRPDTFQKKFDDKQVIHFHRYGNLPGEEMYDEWLALSEKFDCPIWLGESGENMTEWYGAAYPLALRLGIGYNFWPWKRMRGNPVPMEIKPPEGWDRIQGFLKGKERPSYADAQKIFDAYLENIKAENCVFDPTVAGSILRHGPVSIMATDFDANVGAATCRPDVEAATCRPNTDGRQIAAPTYRTRTGMTIKARTGMTYERGPGFQSGWEKLCLNLCAGEWVNYTFFGPGAKFNIAVAGESFAPGTELRLTGSIGVPPVCTGSIGLRPVCNKNTGGTPMLPVNTGGTPMLPVSQVREFTLEPGAFDVACEFKFAAPPDEIVIRAEITTGSADLHTIKIAN